MTNFDFYIKLNNHFFAGVECSRIILKSVRYFCILVDFMVKYLCIILGFNVGKEKGCFLSK